MHEHVCYVIAVSSTDRFVNLCHLCELWVKAIV